MPRRLAVGYDLLGNESRAYAGKLKTAGTPVDNRHHACMIHGFFGFQAAVDVSREAAQTAPAGIMSSVSKVVQRCGCRHDASRRYSL